MKKLVYILIAGCLLFVSYCYSQPVTQEWVKTYTNPFGMSSGVFGMTIDTIGNTYVTGGINTLTENSNYITLKYNSVGDTQWVATYNGPGTNSVDYATAVAVDRNGNVYVTGVSEETAWLTNAYCTIKYNSAGIQQWIKRYKYDPNGSDYPYAIAIDNLSNIYVTGASSAAGNSDYCTIKYNSNGDSVWVRRFNGDGNGNDGAYSIIVDNNGNVYVTGTAYGGFYPYPTMRACTIKYNANGELLWTSMMGGSSLSSANKLALDTLNNFVYVCGSIGNPSDFLLIKYNSNGVQQWFRGYDGSQNGTDYAKDLAIDINHNVCVTGTTLTSIIPPLRDYTTIKYTESGDSLWVRKYNGSGNAYDYSNSIAIDKYSNFYITGNSDGIGGRDFATIKYSSTGNEEWVMRYPGGGVGIRVDKFLNVYVTGNGRNAADLVTIKYSQVDGIKPVLRTIPSEFLLYQNYPNPFNPKSNIKFQIAKLSDAKLVVFDVLGREIAVLVNQELKPGTYEVEFDGSNYPSGVYFYRLTVYSSYHSKWSDEWSETKKMVLMK